MKLIRVFALFSLLTMAACGGGSGASGTSSGPGGPGEQPSESSVSDLHAFPSVKLPMVYGDDPSASIEYTLEHYWDDFFGTGGPTGPKSILGVSDGEVEQALANYIGILSSLKDKATPDDLTPLAQARSSVRTLFSKLEKHQAADTSSLVYLRFTEMVSRYMFDPNSPLRDEDLYLPFVEAMKDSRFTSDDMRPAYAYEARQCRINQFGQKVPDFRFSTADGKKSSLYELGADYVMLFFSNPGCTACQEIINEIKTRSYIDSYISQGRLAIVNIYIDAEVSKWREYLPNYPASWINGYDYTFQLRDSGKFDIRAIPSLYLLDASKRVLLKDAPTEKVLSYLDRI